MTWIQTRDGGAIDLLGDDPIVMPIDLVAHCLARIGRFAGHTRSEHAYSVAQHSVLVSYHVPEDLALRALLHDTHEAVIGDISSPVKYALRDLGDGGAFARLDRNVAARVAAGFGFGGDLPPEVVRADLEARVTERRDLLGNVEAKPWALPAGIKPWGDRIARALSTAEAESLFMERYARLTMDRKPFCGAV